MKQGVIQAIFFALSFFVISINSAMADVVYDRVMKTKTLRCGYFIEPPFTKLDVKTGKFSGLSVELTEMVAKELGLKVEWVEEIAFDTFPQDLKNNRYDMVCGSVFNLPRAGVMMYSRPYAYVPVHGYVKAGNTSFDKSYKDIKWEEVKVSGLDGEGATTAIQKFLPQSQIHLLPQRASLSEMLVTVATNKTDIGFVLPSVFENYNKHNPDVLKRAKLNKPLYTYAVGFGIARGAHDFKAMIDNTINQFIVSGELSGLFNKHDSEGYFNYPIAPIASN